MKLKAFSILLITSIVVSFNCRANSQSEILCETFADGAFKDVCIELPNYRALRGGTKIRTTYSDNCPEELKGAFNYAVKIWEENLPTMLPLNISVKWSDIRSGNNNLLSRVAYRTIESELEFDKECSSPMAQIKKIVLNELQLQKSYRYTDIVDDVCNSINIPDIIITYNINLYDEFSFRINDIVEDKYDFVTLALRDIAKGLGLGINITASNNSLVWPTSKKPYYETRIWSALKNETAASAYEKCTQGTLYVSGLPTLYAPNPWQNGVSLQYFIPEDDNSLSRLLAYDFGKGYVMRDLSGLNWNNLIHIMDWYEMMTVGGSTGSVTEKGNTQQVLPYKGIIDLSQDFMSLSDISDSHTSMNESEINDINDVNYQSTGSIDFGELCEPYRYFYTGAKNVAYGYSVSALLNDGKWDVLFAEYYPSSLTFNIEDLKLNYPDSLYARSCSGGLRYRLTKCEEIGGSNNPNRCYVKYFTRDYLPQKANIKFSKISSPFIENSLNNTIIDDGYFQDVEIGISNIEGVTKLIVEQLDEGDDVPFRYEVDDFKQGYFIANLIRDVPSKLTVYTCNENGMTKSNTIEVDLTKNDETPNLTFTFLGTHIKVSGYDFSKRLINYRIIDCNTPRLLKVGVVDKYGMVPIQSLTSGMYILEVIIDRENFCYKFVKQ